MTIFFVTSSRIPSERAYGYAIMKLCEEWGRAGHAVRLVVGDRKYGPQNDAWTYYGLERTFEIENLPASDLLGAGTTLSRLRFLFGDSDFPLMPSSTLASTCSGSCFRRRIFLSKCIQCRKETFYCAARSCERAASLP